MASQADVRRIALSFPGAEEVNGRFAFFVRNKDKAKEFAWVWMERIDPRKARVPQPKALAVMVASVAERDLMVRHDPVRFFTEPHYEGFPAVLVRLPEITVRQLRPLLEAAWRIRAPRDPGEKQLRLRTRN